MTHALRILALAVLCATPAVAQERYRTRHHDSSFSIGYDSRAGVHASLRFGSPRRSTCGTVPRRHWVAGYWDRVWIDPIYDVRYQSCGTPYRVLVRAGYWKRVWRPGHWSYDGYGSQRRGSVRRAY